MSVEASDWLEAERRLRFYRNTRRLIGYLAASLAVAFSWLKLRGSELLPAATALPEGVVIRAALVFWYASWLYGCLTDIEQQERVYQHAPNAGRIPLAALLIVFGITAAFALLCSAPTVGMLLLTLSGFWLINALAWIYLTRVMLLKILGEEESRVANSISLAERERPAVVQAYLYGRWQAWRFVVGIFSLVLLAIGHRTDVPITLPGGAAITIARAVPLGIGMFIVGAEIWVWIMRLRMWFCLDFLNRLGEYQLAE